MALFVSPFIHRVLIRLPLPLSLSHPVSLQSAGKVQQRTPFALIIQARESINSAPTRSVYRSPESHVNVAAYARRTGVDSIATIRPTTTPAEFHQRKLAGVFRVPAGSLTRVFCAASRVHARRFTLPPNPSILILTGMIINPSNDPFRLVETTIGQRASARTNERQHKL